MLGSGFLPHSMNQLPLPMRLGKLALWVSAEHGVLYQDSAGTTRANADTDPVGLIMDLSGNACNFDQINRCSQTDISN